MEKCNSEERIISALAHGCMIMPGTWLAPLVIWITAKSGFVRSHARQATGWQVLCVALMIVAMIMWVVGSGIVILLMPGHYEPTAGGGTYHVDEPGPAGLSIIRLAFFPLAGIAYVAFIIVSLIAAAKAWRGASFVYPLVGKMIELWAEQSPTDASGGDQGMEGN